MKNTLSKTVDSFSRVPVVLTMLQMNTNGPRAWAIILVFVLLFFLPFAIPGYTFHCMGGYGALAVVPVIVSTFFHARKGGIIATILLMAGLALVNCLEAGFPWPHYLVQNWCFGGIGLFILSVMAGQFSHASRQLTIAHAKSQQAEMQMALAYQQQVEVNELKDQFLFNVSHELRTPLTQVYGYLELLRAYQGTLEHETQASFINHATQGCEELLLLLNTILDAARLDQNIHPPNEEKIALASIVHEMIEQFEPQQRQHHPFYVDIDEELVVLADAQFLRQVLRNLFSNALKYSPIHSAIEIHAEILDPLPQELDGIPQIRVAIQDAGPGIPPSDIPLLFGKFVRLQRDLGGSIPGTGLGLYISKHLVQVMGGRIWVESSGIAGEGSCFYFTLPLALDDNAENP